MGYTHYYPQRRDFTDQEWDETVAATRAIIFLANVNGIQTTGDNDRAADYEGGGGTFSVGVETSLLPEVPDVPYLCFNGDGKEGHQAFVLYRVRPPLQKWDTGDEAFQCCKTAQKPYDLAVVAVLCYIASRHEGLLSVGSDGDISEWEDGLRHARTSLPHLAGKIDMPASVSDPETDDHDEPAYL